MIARPAAVELVVIKSFVFHDVNDNATSCVRAGTRQISRESGSAPGRPEDSASVVWGTRGREHVRRGSFDSAAGTLPARARRGAFPRRRYKTIRVAGCAFRSWPNLRSAYERAMFFEEWAEMSRPHAQGRHRRYSAKGPRYHHRAGDACRLRPQPRQIEKQRPSCAKSPERTVAGRSTRRRRADRRESARARSSRPATRRNQRGRGGRNCRTPNCTSATVRRRRARWRVKLVVSTIPVLVGHEHRQGLLAHEIEADPAE